MILYTHSLIKIIQVLLVDIVFKVSLQCIQFLQDYKNYYLIYFYYFDDLIVLNIKNFEMNFDNLAINFISSFD